MKIALDDVAFGAAIAAATEAHTLGSDSEMQFEEAIRAYLSNLPKTSPVMRTLTHHNRPYTEYPTAVDYGVRIGNYTRETFPFDEAAVRSAGYTLAAMGHGISVASGWYEDPTTGDSLLEYPGVSEKIALIHSEVSEALEGHRKRQPDEKLPERPALEVELADAIWRIADLAGAMRLDLGGALAEKAMFNLTRPDHARGARAGVDGKAF